jgi:hypothetical protein
MAINRGYTFGATEQVTNAKLHTLVDSATISAIVNNDIDANAQIDETKINFDGSTVCKLSTTQTVSGNKTFSGLTNIYNLIGSLASFSSARIGTLNTSALTTDSLIASLASINNLRVTSISGIPRIDNFTASLASIASLNITTLTGYTPPNTGNVIFNWSGAIDSDTNTSFFVSAPATLNDTFQGATSGYSYWASKSDSYQTILTSKFRKISGINTVTINALLWTKGTTAPTLKVDIGGQNNTVTRTAGTTPTWVTTSDIDVSGLTNGTTYDITIQFKSSVDGDPVSVYCGGVILIAS